LIVLLSQANPELPKCVFLTALTIAGAKVGREYVQLSIPLNIIKFARRHSIRPIFIFYCALLTDGDRLY